MYMTKHVYMLRARPGRRRGVKAVAERTGDQAGGTERRPLWDTRLRPKRVPPGF